MFKRFLIIALIGAVGGGFGAALLVGNIKSGKGSEAIIYVLDEYLNAWKGLDPRGMYRYISFTESTKTSQKEYIEQFRLFPVRPISHKINKITIDSQTAKAEITIGWPDIGTGGELLREELFYLVREQIGWRIIEDLSLQE